MKSLLLLPLLFLGVMGCSPVNEVDITPSINRRVEVEPAAPSASKQPSLPALETAEPDIQSVETIQTEADQIKPISPLDADESSPELTIISPSGVVDLSALESGNSGIDNGRMEEMPYPGLPNRQVAMIEMSKQDLADNLGLEMGDIILSSVTILEVPGDSLDCKLKGGGRRPMIVTFGYQIALEAAGKEYFYLAEPGGTLSFCGSG